MGVGSDHAGDTIDPPRSVHGHGDIPSKDRQTVKSLSEPYDRSRRRFRHVDHLEPIGGVGHLVLVRECRKIRLGRRDRIGVPRLEAWGNEGYDPVALGPRIGVGLIRSLQGRQ